MRLAIASVADGSTKRQLGAQPSSGRFFYGPPAQETPVATHAETMVAALEAALEDAPVGVVSVTVDGQVTRFDHSEAVRLLDKYRRERARQRGTRPTLSSIDLSGF